MKEKNILDYACDKKGNQVLFYQMPKALFDDPRFTKLTTDSKILYSLMLDRQSISAKNNWIDEDGRNYIYFSVEEITKKLCCGRDKAFKVLAELDNKKGVGLIERKFRGQGKPTVIYVKVFSSNFNSLKVKNSTSKSRNKPTLEKESVDSKESSISTYNNIDLINNNKININSFILLDEEDDERKPLNQYKYFRKIICEKIDYEGIVDPGNFKELDEILAIMVDVVCSNGRTIRVGGDNKPVSVVREQFLNLNCQHIEFVLSCMKKNTTKIRNIRSYLITTLYNAPMTIENFNSSLFSHNKAKGLV